MLCLTFTSLTSFISSDTEDDVSAAESTVLQQYAQDLMHTSAAGLDPFTEPLVRDAYEDALLPSTLLTFNARQFWRY